MPRPSASRRAFERASALALAGAVHGLMFLALISAGAGKARIADADAVNIALIGEGFEPAAGGAPPRASPAESLADELRRSSAGAFVPLPPEPKASRRSSLSELFGETDGQARDGATATSALNGLARQAAGALGDPRTQASAPRRPVFDKDGNVLPCWTKPARPTPVKVVVVLDARGAMVGRPAINRQGRASPDAAAEAEAMRAMAGCAPYAPATIAGTYRVVELDFSRDRDWVREAGTIEIR